MVFKRRDKRPLWQIALEFVYPKGGWTRAFYYVRHRLNRLPDSPERIARGLSVGVFAAFTPLFGLHFILALGLAKIFRGNLLSSLMGTFIGNPITFVPIAVASLRIGDFMLGRTLDREIDETVGHQFINAWLDLWRNMRAVFNHNPQNWEHLASFFDRVFLPYLIGGIIPGVVAGLIVYYLSVPVIRAYQNRRIERLRKKIEAHRKTAAKMAKAKAKLAKD